MVIEFNKNIVWDYINGKDIENIDELEDDYKFMMEVISITNDKNMYNLCSDKVKENYDFIKFMVYTFKNDKDFVNEIALEYLNKVAEDDITYRELIFIMSELFNNRYDKRAIYYNAKRAVIYTSQRVIIDTFISEEFDEKARAQYGLGFAFVLVSDLSGSDVIINYFAKKFLDEIFYENDGLSLEELVHSKISNLNKLNMNGVKNFILDYVKNYDVILSDYLFVHINLIEDVEKDINIIVDNWDNYLEKTLDIKRDIFEQEVNNFIFEYGARFDYNDVCSYIDRNLNLSVKLCIFNNYDIYFIDMRRINLKEYECLKKIIQLAKDLFLSPVIKKDYLSEEFMEEKHNNNKRILHFKSNTIK